MEADDIPTSVTSLVYTAPALNTASRVLSQNETAEFLAHFWPTIEAHIREQVAQEVGAACDRNLAEYPNEPAMRGRRLGLIHAARIARRSFLITSEPTTDTTTEA